MAGKAEQAKGRIKEAAGDLTGDEDLEREGTADRISGKVKETLGDVKDWVEDKVDDVKDAARRH